MTAILLCAAICGYTIFIFWCGMRHEREQWGRFDGRDS